MKTRLRIAIVALALLNSFPANALVTITRHPTNQWVSLGAHVTNSVTASSTAPPITYQWWGKGVLLPDQTNRTCILTNIQLDSAGDYYVVVNDADNQPLQSNAATVTVDPTFIKITEGAIVTDREPSISSTWWDYDGDGHPDLYVANNACFNGCPATNSLYHNLGGGTFQRVTNVLSTRVVRSSTVAAADFDNNGTEDLYVLGNTAPQYDPNRYPTDELYRNEAGGTFSPVRGQPWSRDVDTSNDCGWADYDRDGLLDVFVANVYETYAECLYRQRTDGSFVKMTAAQAGSIVGVNLSTDACSWADYDNDGDPDLWLSSRDGRARLHQNDGRAYFSAATNAGSITAINANCTGVWGDYDNDGWLDLFAVSLPDGPVTAVNALHRNLQGTSFTNVALAAGVALANNAWASAWGDCDNDGWLDIFVANITGGTNLLYRNRGDGTFEMLDVGSPVRDGDLRATVAWVDYDNDGFLDLFVTCGNGTSLPNHLYHNNLPVIGNGNHWLKVKLTGQAANRSGIGAKVRVKATIRGQEIWQVREISGNSGYQGGYGLMAHFGLGDATQADVVHIEWPSGNVQEMTNVAAGQTGQGPLTITELVYITPTRPSSSLGGSVALRSQRAGTWQWYHDGVALDGQTGQTLTLSAITTIDAGRYSVAVNTASGTFTNHVYLLVDTQFERIAMGDTTASWGCAWGDYDNDNYPDLFVGVGAGVSPSACALYRNNRDATLIKVTPDEAGSVVELLRSWQCGAWADYDNDGQLDLMVTDNPLAGEPQPALWHNLGNGRFEDATEAGSFLSDRPYGAPLWGDFNRDGFLDLAVANAWDEPPTWRDWSRNLLYLNQRDGTFGRVTTDDLVVFRAGLMVEGGAAGDMEGDGDLDILLCSHTGIHWFENNGSGQFRRVTTGFPSISGMSITPSWADYDNDGRPDVFVAVYSGTSQLLHNNGDGQWTAIPLGAPLQTSGGSWADYDNDGDLDLFISRGQSTTTTNLLYANNGDGTFTQVTLGSMANDQGRAAGSAWADYDNNGFQDLFVTGHAGTPEVLYRNHGNENHWISFKLVGTRSNRSAIGAKVRVRATIFGKTYWQMREIGGGNRHQNDLRPHFGLGDAPRATTVRVEWPSGAVEEFANLARDQFHTLIEPSLRGAMQPNGEFALSVTGSTNRLCTVDYSTNLITWTTLTNFTATGEIPVTVTDPDAPGQTQRFYRMR